MTLATAAALLVSFAAAAVQPVAAQPPSSSAVLVDRAVARFWAPETGGARRPYFVYARVLAFEARLEALSDSNREAGGAPYRERHVTAALERHVAESLLAGPRIDPEPTEAELAQQVQQARARLLARVGGEAAFRDAARAEGMGSQDVFGILRRQARASLYLDRMVAPMLDPSEAELRQIHRTRRNPFRELPFERIVPGLRRWVISQRLNEALQSFYQNARGRLTLTPLGPLPGS